LRACIDTGLPVIVHSRDAEEDTIRIIREEGAGTALKGVLHCFSSQKILADEALELGTYGGLCSYFQKEFDYPLCKIFTSLGYDKDAYVFPVIWLSAFCSWEEHALPRVEFLKNFKAELSKMGY
jgi:hypothetical protein